MLTWYITFSSFFFLLLLLLHLLHLHFLLLFLSFSLFLLCFFWIAVGNAVGVYLHAAQPRELQQRALQLFKALAVDDPDAV